MRIGIVLLSLIAVSASAQQCDIIYVTTTGAGGGPAGTRSNPASLTYGLTLITPTSNRVWIAVGTYNISNTIAIPDNCTLEGGFDPTTWIKSNATESIIMRDNLNPVPANALIGLEGSSATGFRLQDLTINVANAPGFGNSVYGIYLGSCSNYNITRCKVITGTGATGNPGTLGTPGTAGGGGLAGGPGACNNETGVPAGAGGTGAGGNDGGAGAAGENHSGGPAGSPGLTAGCGGAGGASGSGPDDCLFCSPSCGDVIPGSNGTAGGTGNQGSTGSPGPVGTVTGGYFVAGGIGGAGTDGTPGCGGGGGGGGGGRQQSGQDDKGGGGGGGGGGGSGGIAGNGGFGGGSAYAIFVFTNGAGGVVEDCQLSPGTAGAGGGGGAGGAGGGGGAGGAGGAANCCASSYGGTGGTGGAGGAGGNGGNGATGQSVALSENGGIGVNNQGITVVPGNPPIITVENYGCVNSVVTFTGDVVGNWTFGIGASPANAFGMGPHEVVYSSMGRKTVSHNGVDFTEYVDIFNLGPGLPSITPLVDTVVLGCPTTFTTSLTSTNYEWVFGPYANPDTMSGPTFQTTDSVYYQQLGLYTYELWVTDTCCGRVKDTALVYVDTSFLDISLTASSDTVCAGDLLTFTADVGFTNYEFFLNGASVQNGPSNMYGTTSQQTGDIISVVGFLGSCYSNESSALTNVVIPIPPVNITISDPDTTICQGDTVTFIGNPSTYQNYEFFVGTTSVQNGPSNVYTTSTLNDLDSITCVSYLGCPGPPSNTIYFNVNALPFVTISSTDTTFCAGDPITVTASPSGLADYQILVNGVTAGSGTQNSVTTNLFSNGDSVVVVPTSNNGCVGLPSNDIVFVVNPIPAVTLAGSADTVCLFDALVFSATLAGMDNYDFYDGATLIQSGSSNILTTTTLAGGTHNITVIATDLDCASPVSNIIVATVLAGPTVTLASTVSTICAGDTVVFTGTPTGLLNYEFFVAGVSVQSGASDSLTTGSLVAGDTVYVVGTNQGCPGPSSNNIVPTVNPLPIITLTSDDSDEIICDGNQVTFTAAPGGLASYDFILNGTSAQIGIADTFITSLLVNGDVLDVIGVSTAGCTGPVSNSLTFTVNPTPIVFLNTSDDSTCWGDGIWLTGIPAGYDNYNFYDNGVLIDSGGTGAYLYVPDSANLITVIATNINCPSLVSNDTSIVVIYGPVTTVLSSDANGIICDGDAVTFTASPASLGNYDFYVNGISVQSNNSDSYTTTTLVDGDTVFVIGDSLGCAGPASNSLPFVVNSIPLVGCTNPDPTICFGETTTFSASPATLDTYEFFVNGVSQQNGTSPTFDVSVINDGDIVTIIGTYLGCPSPASNGLPVFVDPLPTATFTSDTVCQGDPTTPYATDGPGSLIAAYMWVPETGADTLYGNPPSPRPIYAAAGTYTATLIIEDTKTCRNFITNQVVVDPNPVAEFILTPDSTNLMNPVITFTDVSNPPSPDSLSLWQWDFGDGESSAIQHPIHEYADSGYYTIELLVTNEFGCVDSITHLVKIEPEYIIHFPNAFTPNGDTYNDVFLPAGVGINYDFEMYIFNRWGDLIFESFDSNIAWDGTGNHSKQLVQEGVYVYAVYFRDHLGQQHEYVGHVALIR